MGLERLFARRGPVDEERAYQSWWNLAGAPGLISSAVYGTPGIEQALTNPASRACINVLASALARTPADVMRGTGSRTKSVSPAPNVVVNPSGLVQLDVWRYQLAYSMFTDGNAFGRITATAADGLPDMIEMLDAATVTERKVVKGVAQVTIDSKDIVKLYPFGDIWHVPGGMVPSGTPFARSPVRDAADTIATSLAAQQFSRQFFTDGGHPSSIISSDKPLTAEQARAIKEAWRRATTGNREVAVLGGDLKHEQVQINPGDSQFIDLMRYSVEDVCRIWGVPPSMVYGAVSGESVTYANVTDADLAFLKHSLDPYYVRLETAMTALLPVGQYVKFNRNAILRADPKSRFDANAVALANRQVTVNELRALEDLAGFGPDFDVPGIPPFAAPAQLTLPLPGVPQ